MPAETPALAPEQPDLVWFRGADATRFLNDLITQEVSTMEVGESRRSLLLGPDGKLDQILRVIRTDDGIGLVTDGGLGEGLAGTLGRYRIRVDVTIEPESQPRHIVVGEWAGYDVSWEDVPRHLVVGPRPDLPSLTKEEYNLLRAAAGEPRLGVDLERGVIPQETSLVPVTVDFDKGCFLGQELVARIDSRGGQAPSMLRRLELDAPSPVGTPILLDDVGVGVLTTTSGTTALALLPRRVEPGMTVVVGGALAKVREITRKPQG